MRRRHSAFRVEIFLLATFAVAAAGCARPDPNAPALEALQSELSVQYHACVPLGWEPLRVTGAHYVPGYNATAVTYEEWLDAIWRGSIPQRDLRNPHARHVFDVLNALVDAGLLTRKQVPARYNYFLTPSAFAYFYGNDRYGSNHDSLPYLCYSTIDPKAVLSREPIGDNQYRVVFTWTPGPDAAWAQSQTIREHSITLAPQRNPAYARMFERKGLWGVADIYDGSMMLPSVADASAWR